MNPRNVVFVVGLLLRPFAFLLLLPALIDLYDGEINSALTFAITAGAIFVAGVLISRKRVDPNRISRIEAMAVVANSWLLAALLGSIPYVRHGFGPVDALFESMSGFTTTGATVFLGEDFAGATRGLIFWRSLTQWVGGMGIIVLFVAILPALAVAGRQMFFAEAPGPEEETLTPRIRHTAAALYRIYIGLTAIEAILLATVGDMSIFDSVCHACTTLAAGGFSPNGQSIAGYGPAAQWIITCFMFLAGASFALQYRALSRPKVMLRDPEFRAYFWILVGAGVAMAGLLVATSEGGYTLESSLRHGLFQSASILTTTGYASEDFNTWSQSTLMVLAGLMFIGGCAGSAGGGPKVVRMVILAKFLSREVLIALHPRVVKVIRLGGRPVPKDTTRQLVGFIVAYFTIFGVVALIAGIIENDFRIGFTGSIVTIGNIGPGFGALGPMESFRHLAVPTKLLFIFNMWVGRLEVMSVLVLLHPELLGALFRRRR